MNNTLFAARGAVYLLTGNPGPYWKISPTLPTGNCPPVLLSTVEITSSDVVAKSVCFNNKRVAAATSKDFGKLSAGGVALLGSNAGSASFSSEFTTWFNRNRIINKGSPCAISFGNGGGGNFLLDTATLGDINEEYNIQKFSFGGIYLD